MPPLRTRECTEVFTTLPVPHQEITIAQRQVEVVNRFEQRVFNSEDHYQGEPILTSLNQRLDYENRRKNEGKRKPEPVFQTRKLTFKEKIDRKREFVKRVILNKSHWTLKEIAKFTGCHWNTVKKINSQLQILGDVLPYQPKNPKTVDQLNGLHQTIKNIEDTGMSVSDIQRMHPSFSERRILEELHKSGMRYKLLPKKRKNPTVHVVNSTRVCRVISHICQGLADHNTEVLYCDEMKFPLNQTSTHSWTTKQDDQRPVYNRRPDERILNAIALCTIRGFVAVQVFMREITGADFLYFLNKSIASLPTGKTYTVILDNATWHSSSVVMSSEAKKFLFFNEPRHFQLNIIEAAFSFVRGAFRKRPFVEGLEAESREILKIFFDEKNEQRFQGILRLHLRQLIKYHEKHWKKIAGD